MTWCEDQISKVTEEQRVCMAVEGREISPWLAEKASCLKKDGRGWLRGSLQRTFHPGRTLFLDLRRGLTRSLQSCCLGQHSLISRIWKSQESREFNIPMSKYPKNLQLAQGTLLLAQVYAWYSLLRLFHLNIFSPSSCNSLLPALDFQHRTHRCESWPRAALSLLHRLHRRRVYTDPILLIIYHFDH